MLQIAECFFYSVAPDYVPESCDGAAYHVKSNTLTISHSQVSQELSGLWCDVKMERFLLFFLNCNEKLETNFIVDVIAPSHFAVYGNSTINVGCFSLPLWNPFCLCTDYSRLCSFYDRNLFSRRFSSDEFSALMEGETQMEKWEVLKEKVVSLLLFFRLWYFHC